MESFIFLVEWRLVLTISFGKSNPWNHKMAQQVNVGISSQTVSAPQQQQQQKKNSIELPLLSLWYDFFLLRVLLTNIAITVFHVRNSECLNKASLKALQRTLLIAPKEGSVTRETWEPKGAWLLPALSSHFSPPCFVFTSPWTRICFSVYWLTSWSFKDDL